MLASAVCARVPAVDTWPSTKIHQWTPDLAISELNSTISDFDSLARIFLVFWVLLLLSFLFVGYSMYKMLLLY